MQASEAEANWTKDFEELKGVIYGLAIRLTLVAETPSDAFKVYGASQVNTIKSLLESLDPLWDTQPHMALVKVALEVFTRHQAGAREIARTIESTGDYTK